MVEPPKEYVSGLRRFQQRYGLPITGELDVATAALLTAPRCGNPDQAVSDTTLPRFHTRLQNRSDLGNLSDRPLRRVKRYLIGDEKMKWTKKKLTWQ